MKHYKKIQNYWVSKSFYLKNLILLFSKDFLKSQKRQLQCYRRFIFQINVVLLNLETKSIMV